MPGTSVTVQAVFEKIQESSTPESSEPESSTPESSEPESSTPAESESSDITESSETPGGGDENSNIPDSSETPEVPDNPPAEGGSDGGSAGEEGFIGTGGNDYPESFGDLSNYTADYRVTAVEIKDTESVTVYYGWHDQDGKTYYYDQNGNKVTGQQVIDGITYYFDSEGALQKNASQTVGIDVSTWQNSIDWDRVKASGISFVIIRCGFRGYGSGKIVEDDMFRANIAGAKAAGLKVGVYFFSQAINTAEAVEEASACISLVRSSGYSIELPIVIDVEYAAPSARTNSLSRSDLTKICVAFCDTCRSSGYSAMVYANKYYLEWKLYPSEFSNYYIWLAHYTGGSISSYSGRYNMWQYTSVGTVDGVQGGVDMNYSYVW